MSRRRILFVASKPTSFVRDDLALLGERYDVSPLWFDPARPLGQFRAQARALRTARADLVYGWFADYPMALPVRWARRRGVPSVVAIGGYDAVRLPSLGYGVFESRWRAPLARYVCRRATHLVPVHASLLESRNAFATWPDVAHQGVRAHVAGLTTPATVIPTGYDPEGWPLGAEDRPPSVLTVAHVTNERTYRLKGLDLIEAAAALLPDVPFDVVGVDPEVAERLLPPNVSLRPPVARENLASIYAAASVYVQPSRSEGLPNALCEAMLAGCIPVVSPVGGMPDAVGEWGGVVAVPTGEAISEAVSMALEERRPSAREGSRSAIADRFTVDRRRAGLFDLIDGLLRR